MSKFLPRTKQQNSALHKLLGERGFTDDDKAEMVHDITGGRTEHSSEMSVEECNRMIVRLGGDAIEKTVPRRTMNHRKQKAGIQTIISSLQTGKIERLLRQRGISGEGERALCQRIIKRDEPRTTSEANKIIEALKAMIARDANRQPETLNSKKAA